MGYFFGEHSLFVGVHPLVRNGGIVGADPFVRNAKSYRMNRARWAPVQSTTTAIVGSHPLVRNAESYRTNRAG